MAARSLRVVFRKEMTDALRDRRTLLAVLLSAVLIGPLVLLAISGLVASLEARAEQREIVVDGIEQAPTLRNFLARQTYSIKPAPSDYRVALRKGTLGDPVVVVPPDFETALSRGDVPTLAVVSDSANQRADAATARVERLLAAFARERASLAVALRGVALQTLDPVVVDERDLASTQTRATRVTGMLPYFVMMAVLYGALHAALDTTAGERERGSLEPLLLNPAERWAIVAGKWLAVAAVSMSIATLSSLGFLPGQWMLRSDSLAAMFQYGPREAAMFLVVLLPFAAALAAVLMAVAIRCKTVKEAQANSTVVLLAVSLLPLVSVFDLGGEAPWHLWVPALAQNVLMTRTLKGETLGFGAVAISIGVCAALTVASVAFVARRLRRAAAS